MRIENMVNFANIMGTAMQGTVARHNIITNNITNVDTPGFKRSIITFEDQLSEAISNFRNTGNLNLSGIQPSVRREYDFLNFRVDENNVDIEFEMASLYQNSIRFDVMAAGIMHHYRMISTAANMMV